MPASLSSSQRWLIAAALAAVLIAAAGYWWHARPLSLATGKAVRGAVVDAIYATGSVEPSVMMPIAPRSGGRLAERSADEGDRVRKGQVLARLDDADLAGTVDELQARSAYARQQYERALALAERGFIARGEVDRSHAELDAQLAALRRARAQRSYMTLTAPADGVIIRRDGETGQYIAAGQAVFILSCCAPLRVTADVDEEDINRVYAGQRVLLHADAVPGRVYEGSVREITPKGDPVARSYRVRISLADAAGLQAGMTMDANLIVATRSDALLLPVSAVQDGKVWLLRDGRLERRAVQAGLRTAQRIEIVSGLDGDEQVVLQPDPTLAAGRRARPAEPRR